MRHQRALDFHCAQTMARNVDDVVHAPHDPEVAVLVTAGPVAGEVCAFNLAEVLLPVTIGISKDRAEHARPWPPDYQQSALVRPNRLAVAGHNFGRNPGQWTRR